MLQAIIEKIGAERFPSPHHFDDAAWIGYRLSEVLPISLDIRQQLLRIDGSADAAVAVEPNPVPAGICAPDRKSAFLPGVSKITGKFARIARRRAYPPAVVDSLPRQSALCAQALRPFAAFFGLMRLSRHLDTACMPASVTTKSIGDVVRLRIDRRQPRKLETDADRERLRHSRVQRAVEIAAAIAQPVGLLRRSRSSARWRHPAPPARCRRESEYRRRRRVIGAPGHHLRNCSGARLGHHHRQRGGGAALAKMS